VEIKILLFYYYFFILEEWRSEHRISSLGDNFTPREQNSPLGDNFAHGINFFPRGKVKNRLLTTRAAHTQLFRRMRRNRRVSTPWQVLKFVPRGVM
jgi:hypothetical protein